MSLSIRPQIPIRGKSQSFEDATLISPRLRSIWICLAVTLFLIQSLPYLSHRWVTDESWYAGPGYSIAHGNGIKDPAIGPNDLENHFDARPPGTAIVIACFFKLLGTGQIAARLGSVFAGLTVVLLTYQLARGLLNEEGAFVAALLVATDNFLVLVSRTARPEALTIMSVLFSLLAIKKYKDGGIVWAFIGGVLMALATMFHITVLGYLFSVGILVIYIDWQSKRFLLRGACAYSVGFIIGLVPFAAWILSTPLGRAGFRQEYLARAVAEPLLTKLIHEQHRYLDMFGYNMMHGHGLEALPIRLPIPLFILASSYLLWRFRRKWFYLELLLLAPSLIWFIETANKSSRYLSLFSPVLAFVIGGAVSATSGRKKLHRIVLSLACLTIAAQWTANLLLIKSARKADYNALGTKLRSVVPQGEAVYGTITFWLAFHDRPFISYERTDPWMAANDYHVRYFILGDRMMTQGVDWDKAFYQSMNQHLAEITRRSKVVGRFPDPYYGDLIVYKFGE